MKSEKRMLAVYFFLTFALTWGLGGLVMLLQRWSGRIDGLGTAANLAAFAVGFVPANVAIFLTLAGEGLPGLKRLLGGLTRGRISTGYYLFILLAIPAATLAATLLVGGQPGAGLGGWSVLPGLFLMALISPAGLGEEIGWRGFALPHLQRGWSAFSASLVIGVLATANQACLFLIPGLPQPGMSLVTLFWTNLAVSILATWLFNSTRGSLLAVVLLRIALVLAVTLTGVPAEVMAALLVVLALYVVTRAGPESLVSPSVHQPVLTPGR